MPYPQKMRRVNLDNSEGWVPERLIEESLPEVSHCTPIQLVQKPLRTHWTSLMARGSGN